jgi:TPR repeat protein
MKYLLIISFLFNFSFIAESNTEIDINQNPNINLTKKYINDLNIIWNNIYQKQLKIKNKELDNLLIIEKYADDINNEELFYSLGVVYMNIPNSIKAFKWMKLAANTNYPNALHNIGWWYDQGFGHIKEDNDKALEYYNKAFWELGLARSGGRLAEIYLTADGFKKNKNYAKKILLKIIKNKDNLIVDENDIILAEYNLGLILRYSISEEQDLDKSLLYFLSAASKGHEQSLVESGQLYRQKYRENGKKKNNNFAEELYKLAVQKGNTDAMVYLSLIYYEKYSNGIEKNINLYKFKSWIYTAYKIGIQNKDLIDNVAKFVDANILNNNKLIKVLEARTEVCINKKFIDCY